MKKTLIALAVMAAAGAASAQSSVTLFGIVDAGYAHGSGSVSNKTQLLNSGYNSSRLGFRGVEDMGGGSKAGFWLEAGLNNDNGSGANTNTNNQGTGSTGGGGLTFNRRSTVSIGGGWGELRLGREYTPQFWNLTVYDPFGTNGVGTTQTSRTASFGGNATGVRASNSITYLWGHGFNATSVGGNGFHLMAQYYLGENNSGAATSKDGKGIAFRAGYGAGPFNVAVGYGNTDYAAGDVKMTNIGAEYKLSGFTLQAQHATAKQNASKATSYMLGGLVPVGNDQIRLAYSQYKTNAAGTPKTGQFSVGYVANMSKRTAVYATYAHASNSGGASFALNGSVTAANQGSNGYEVGVRHAF